MRHESPQVHYRLRESNPHAGFPPPEDFKSNAGRAITPNRNSGSGHIRNPLPTACPPTFVEPKSDLATVIDVWDRLPEAIKAGIVATVRAVSQGA